MRWSSVAVARVEGRLISTRASTAVCQCNPTLSNLTLADTQGAQSEQQSFDASLHKGWGFACEDSRRGVGRGKQGRRAELGCKQEKVNSDAPRHEIEDAAPARNAECAPQKQRLG
jgi:hypothetical protein